MNPAGSRFLLAWTWRPRPVFPWEWSVSLQTSSWWLRLIGEMPTLLELSHWNWLNSCWWWIKPYFYPFARGQLHCGTSESSYFQMFHDKMCSEPPGYFVSWKIDLFPRTNMHWVIKKRMGQKLQLPRDSSTYTLPEAGWQPAIWIRWHWRCPLFDSLESLYLGLGGDSVGKVPAAQTWSPAPHRRWAWRLVGQPIQMVSFRLSKGLCLKEIRWDKGRHSVLTIGLQVCTHTHA